MPSITELLQQQLAQPVQMQNFLSPTQLGSPTPVPTQPPLSPVPLQQPLQPIDLSQLSTFQPADFSGLSSPSMIPMQPLETQQQTNQLDENARTFREQLSAGETALRQRGLLGGSAPAAGGFLLSNLRQAQQGLLSANAQTRGAFEAQRNQRNLQAQLANQQSQLATRGQDIQAIIANLQASAQARGQDISVLLGNLQAAAQSRGQDIQTMLGNLSALAQARGQDLSAMLANLQAELQTRGQDLQTFLANLDAAVATRGQNLGSLAGLALPEQEGLGSLAVRGLLGGAISTGLEGLLGSTGPVFGEGGLLGGFSGGGGTALPNQVAGGEVIPRLLNTQVLGGSTATMLGPGALSTALGTANTSINLGTANIPTLAEQIAGSTAATAGATSGGGLSGFLSANAFPIIGGIIGGGLLLAQHFIGQGRRTADAFVQGVHNNLTVNDQGTGALQQLNERYNAALNDDTPNTVADISAFRDELVKLIEFYNQSAQEFAAQNGENGQKVIFQANQTIQPVFQAQLAEMDRTLALIAQQEATRLNS